MNTFTPALTTAFRKNEANGVHNSFIIIEAGICESVVHGLTLQQGIKKVLSRYKYSDQQAQEDSRSLDFLVKQGVLITPLTQIRLTSLKS